MPLLLLLLLLLHWQVNRCVKDLRLDQYVVAIEDNFSDSDLQQRFAFMQSKGVHQVALWMQVGWP